MKLEIRAVSGSLYYTRHYENDTSFVSDMASGLIKVQNIFGDEVLLMSSAIESIREVDE